MRRPKCRLVSKAAIDELALIIEGHVKEAGRYDDWLDHIRKIGMDESYLATDNDWPCRMAVWYLEGC